MTEQIPVVVSEGEATQPTPHVAVRSNNAKSRRKIALASSGLGMGGGSTTLSANQGFYSPHMSTDFLEQPQSEAELERFYNHFYDNHPYVGQAIDLHTELPLSKTRLHRAQATTAKGAELAKAAQRRCQKWVDKVNLLQKLAEISHFYWLEGKASVFVEDSDVQLPGPQGVENYIDTSGKAFEDLDSKRKALFQKNYKGWSDIKIIPNSQVSIKNFYFTDLRIVELHPSDEEKELIKSAPYDEQAKRIVDQMDPSLVAAIQDGRNIPLGTDPMKGSFFYRIDRSRGSGRGGQSILRRCVKTLILEDKLRQAQTSIASRAMTPKRLVWAEDLSEDQVEALRDQVDLALMDPDFSIVTNYQVNWEELGANDRLLDLSSEHDRIDKELYTALGVTESLLSGESSYSGDRINLQVINIRYMFYRLKLQDFVDKWLFEPMCRKWGYVEIDEDGDEIVLNPKLGFTRLDLRDDRETLDTLFNLYQKGSLPINVIYEILGIDPDAAKTQLVKDLFTVNDANYNEMIRSALSTIGNDLPGRTNVLERIAEDLGLDVKPESDGGGGRY